MDDGAAQTPARAREDGEASDHQEDGAWQGDFATLGSLWDTAESWAELGRAGHSLFFKEKTPCVKSQLGRKCQ